MDTNGRGGRTDRRRRCRSRARCQMVEIECPFCGETCRMEAAAFTAEPCSFRCETCRVDVEISGTLPLSVPLAA